MKAAMKLTMLMCAVALAASSAREGSAPRHGAAGFSSLPSAAQATISAALGRDIAGYQMHGRKGSFQARNARQQMVEEFTPAGVALRSGSGSLALALLGYGYGNDLTPAHAVLPTASFNRVEYRRGTLTEWYVNGPVGLEQGFTITQRRFPGAGKPLTVALAYSGNLEATVEKSRNSVTLTASGANGRKLRYAGLAARDANGTNLPAWLEAGDGRILLHVSDAAAHYPVTIDPTVQLAELTASDGTADAALGSAVAISGNTVVIGAPGTSTTALGAAYIFVKPAGGWTTTSAFTAKLTASDGLAGDNFGSAVSIYQNTVVIGACSQNVVCNTGPGKAYVYIEPVGGWVSTSAFAAKLTASDGMTSDGFSNSVTISGNTILIGAPGAMIGSNAGQGAAYVYVKPPGGWTSMTETAKLTASDGNAGDSLGFVSLDGSGSTALLGAPYATVGTASQQGAAYIFLKPTHGWRTTSRFNAKLTASDGLSADTFGFCNFGGGCISADGTTVVVGAPQGSFSQNTGPGKGYVFIKPTNGWVTTSQFAAELTASGGHNGDLLGFSAAINLNTIVLGGWGASQDQGVAYVYSKPAQGWKTTSRFSAKLTASNGAPFSFFSYGGAAVSGNTEVVGASGTKVGANADQGAAYVFGP